MKHTHTQVWKLGLGVCVRYVRPIIMKHTSGSLLLYLWMIWTRHSHTPPNKPKNIYDTSLFSVCRSTFEFWTHLSLSLCVFENLILYWLHQQPTQYWIAFFQVMKSWCYQYRTRFLKTIDTMIMQPHHHQYLLSSYCIFQTHLMYTITIIRFTCCTYLVDVGGSISLHVLGVCVCVCSPINFILNSSDPQDWFSRNTYFAHLQHPFEFQSKDDYFFTLRFTLIII